MATFTLDPIANREGLALEPTDWGMLDAEILSRNARWFVRIRWAVVGVLLAFGTITMSAPDLMSRIGIAGHQAWPWGTATILATLNALIIIWLRRLGSPPTRSVITANLWTQIVMDLAVLTVIVYLVGSTSTVIAFTYLFHIALACIFFGRRDSFLVTLLSIGLFLGTVVAEHAGILPRRGILASGMSTVPDGPSVALFAMPTVFVWAVVWYLVSSISEAVRQRDNELDLANKRLLRADQEKNLHVLRVTHDLKSPFSGIESLIQILRQSHWEETPETVRQIISKIEARSATLRARIGDLLALGDLRSSRIQETGAQPVNLRDLLFAVLHEVQGLTTQKRVAVEIDSGDVYVLGDLRQLKILFLNLLSNAISYSHEGGTVRVRVQTGTQTQVRIRDSGIGISAAALPHIFEEFYRSREAVAFNSLSTGLGLAIVRQVARNQGLTLSVSSVEGEGTTFDILFPAERTENRPYHHE